MAKEWAMLQFFLFLPQDLGARDEIPTSTEQPTQGWAAGGRQLQRSEHKKSHATNKKYLKKYYELACK